MKAVIMAGGEGTRLRPITTDIPKPMAPILGKPVMEYAIDLLKKHGVAETAVTLHYLPDCIKSYFGKTYKGMTLKYFVEETPLGTAGSVRSARAFLDDTFVVISGDALTDIDLSAAYAFHKAKGADVTIVLKNVETPVDYGVVIVDGEGRIQRFLEKPPWSDVFSDTVNTGIYLIEPQVMDRIPENTKADFSKDLFPALMDSGANLYGWLSNGYWCDIGNPEQYRHAQFHILSGAVQADCGLPQREPGVFLDPSAEVSPDALLRAPCAVLYGARVRAGAAVGPDAVIGRGALLESGASVERSVLLDNVLLGKAAHVEGAVLCGDVVLEERVRVEDGTALGPGVRVGADAVVAREVSLWPGIRIERHARVTHSQRKASRFSQSLFDDDGIGGTFNDDMTAESVARIAMALGSALRRGSRVAVATWGDSAAVLLRESFDAGLLSTGVYVVDVGRLTVPAARFAARRLRLDGAVHLQAAQGRVHLTLIDGRGANIDVALERKIEDTLAKEDFRRVGHDEIADIIDITGIAMFYEQELFGGHTSGPQDRLIGIYGPDEELNNQAEALLEATGCVCKRCGEDDSLEQACRHAAQDGAKIGLFQRRAGDEFALLDGAGNTWQGDQLSVLLAMVAMDRGFAADTVPLPVMAAPGIDALAKARGVAVERIGGSRSGWLRRACHCADERMCHLFYDGPFAVLHLALALAGAKMELASYGERIPEPIRREQYVDCPLERRGAAMKALHGLAGSSGAYGGALLTHDQGRVFVSPDKQTSRLRVVAQAYREEAADELLGRYREMLDKIASKSGGEAEE